jgi:hypothetical protein
VADLLLAGVHLENVHTRLLWDAGRVQLENVQATVDRAPLSGSIDVNLRGSRPTYKAAVKVNGLPWQSGNLDADGTIETFGTGLQLLTNLTAEGAFTGSALDLGTYGTARNVSGAYSMSWNQSGPRLRFSNISVRTEEETFTGRGATQDDGKLIVSLSSGAREMRMTGTLAKVHVE